jgi:pilus assembly protein CpaE
VYPLTAGIVVESKTLWDELQSSLHDLPVRVLLEQSEVGELSGLVERVERMRPDVIFLDISTLRNPLDQVIRQLRNTAGAPVVLVLNASAEPATILDAMRAGASEYLYPPISEQLRTALERIGNERKSASQLKRRGGHTIGFLSAKGGCGATTIACHTAAELPHQTNSKVLLADLDFDAGMIGFLLKAGTAYNISDAVRNTQRLDENYWKALVSNGISGLEVITAPTPSSRQPLKPEQLRFVLSFTRTQYDWIVMDLGRSLNASSIAALDEVDDLFLVTTLEVPALHQAKVIIQKLLESGFNRNRLHLLLNRAPKRYDVTLEELESMLGVPIYACVPNDYQSLNESYADGKLLPSGSSLSKYFASLAMKIAGVERQKKKFSLFG